MTNDKKQNPIKGILFGLAAGAAASAAMDLYWGAVHNVPGGRPEQKPKKGGKDEQEDEPSTQIVADKISEAVTGHDVPDEDKAAAGVGVHYSTGISFGALFGLFASQRTGWGLLAGLLYGIAIWLGLDEIALRVLRMGPPPEDVPLSQHVQALGAHLVYGSVTGLVSRLLLRVF